LSLNYSLVTAYFIDKCCVSFSSYVNSLLLVR